MRTIAVACFIVALAVAPGALAQDAPSPRFGGCLQNRTTCFAPAVSINLLAVSLRDGSVTTSFAPGVGYGVTFASDRWYRYGTSLSFALRGTADGQKPQLSWTWSFADYVRLGVAYQVGGGALKDAGHILVAFGTDLGSAK